MFSQLFLLFSTLKFVGAIPPSYTCSQGDDPNSPDFANPLKFSDIDGKRFCYRSTINKLEFVSSGADADIVKSIPQYFFYQTTINTLKISTEINTIGVGAFYECTIGTIEFQSTSKLTEISGEAFYKSSFLSDITFPNSLKIIGDYAFCQCKYDISITLPESMNSIGECAFQESNFYFTSKLQVETISFYAFDICQKAQFDRIVILPSGKIESYAFRNCENLDCTLTIQPATTVTSGSLVYSTIGNYAFKGTPISTIILPKMERIGDYAFQNCVQLQPHENPLDIETIGQHAFDGAKKFSFPSITAKTIDSYAFWNCNNLIANGITILPSGTIGVSSFQNCPNLNGVLTIQPPKNKGDPLSTIGNYAFQETPISTIILPKMERIGDYAFQNCDRLQPHENPLDIETIGQYAFDGAEMFSFPSITAKTIDSCAFRNCYNLIANDSITILPSGTIGESSFQYCPKLNGVVTIQPPENKGDPLSTIGRFSFQNTAIPKINLPHIKSIGSYAFQNCVLLTGFYQETKNTELYVDTISDNAFKDDGELHFPTIRAKEIQSFAFQYCRKLNSKIIIIDGGTIGSNAFEYCEKLGTLTFDLSYFDENVIPNTGITIGQYAFQYSGLSEPLVIPFTVQTINQYAFAYCKNIKNLTIESKYSIRQTISNNAFYESDIGANLNIPASVVSIKSEAFAFTKISSLTIEGTSYIDLDLSNPSQPTSKPASIKIDSNAFSNCPNLKKVIFKDGFIDFSNDVFHGSPLQSINLGSITSIPNDAFFGMSTLKGDIEIPYTVRTIGKRAFSECYEIENIKFQEHSQLETIDEAAFYRCSSLQSIPIPSGVKGNIEQKTFYQCKILGSISIPPQIKNIYSYAFYQCSNLDCEITLPGVLKKIGECAFKECYKLKGELNIPDSLTSIDKEAFMGCSKFVGSLSFCKDITTIGESAFRDCSGFNEKLIFLDYVDSDDPSSTYLYIQSSAFRGCYGFKGDLKIPNRCQFVHSQTTPTLSTNVFNGCSGFDGQLIIPRTMQTIPSGTFCGCSSLTGQLNDNFNYVGSNAFRDCSSLSGTLDLTNLSSYTIYSYSFYNCKGLNGQLILPVIPSSLTSSITIEEYAFAGCSGLTGALDASSIGLVGRYGFSGCSGLNGQLNFADKLTRVDEYGFSGCSGFSDTLTFHVGGSHLSIERNAFDGCTGFKDGTLNIYMEYLEENQQDQHYNYDYFLKIGNKAFKDTKFKDVYYLGRFQPDCDYDIGISKTKGIHTSSNFANKTFCDNPIHHNKLSGGAIAGIVIAVIVVVAIIVVLIVFLILRNKKNKDKSEAEVEMNQDP